LRSAFGRTGPPSPSVRARLTARRSGPTRPLSDISIGSLHRDSLHTGMFSRAEAMRASAFLRLNRPSPMSAKRFTTGAAARNSGSANPVSSNHLPASRQRHPNCVHTRVLHERAQQQRRVGFATPGRNRDGLQRDFLDGM
jgi:hypothetical protein